VKQGKHVANNTKKTKYISTLFVLLIFITKYRLKDTVHPVADPGFLKGEAD